MKIIDIVGENYCGKWDKTRTACRGIIIDGSKILLSYETKSEQEVGMVPKWLPIDEIKEIFSKHIKYADTDKMRSGMYLREYTALTELT